jgi:hypothetical protein
MAEIKKYTIRFYKSRDYGKKERMRQLENYKFKIDRMINIYELRSSFIYPEHQRRRIYKIIRYAINNHAECMKINGPIPDEFHDDMQYAEDEFNKEIIEY